jgi:hypothetical protein
VNADDGERLLATGEAAAVPGCHRDDDHRRMRTGTLARVATPGRHSRYRPGDVERLV